MKCYQCKYYEDGKCKLNQKQGRTVLVEKDYYCDKWCGGNNIVINIEDCKDKYAVYFSNPFGAVATITNVSNWSKNNYQFKLNLSLGRGYYTQSNYVDIEDANEIFKQIGFNVTITA